MYHHQTNSINKISFLFIFFSFVFILVNSSTPQPDESFSSNVLVSTKNGSDSFSVYGQLYINYPTKRKLNYDMYYGPVTVIDRCDQSPMMQYTLANSTCMEKTISSSFGNMWEWLESSVDSGPCVSTSQSGKQYTATFSWGIVMGCFIGDLPLERMVTMYRPFSVQVITFYQFNVGPPSTSTFNVPGDCYSEEEEEKDDYEYYKNYKDYENESDQEDSIIKNIL
ncbi:hypothetical protein CYY_003551 [Polysphondylium violaceum]|uniref:Uncharacterized protein n=1 Tax=Polysphondylium violaceum TaxID=133409 RepID=A0A8J4Q6Q0_9MYCE|nr:hypothetical protein CYY_003551 [Polysphondylium violaceum]